jgi:hypothetical protein
MNISHKAIQTMTSKIQNFRKRIVLNMVTIDKDGMPKKVTRIVFEIPIKNPQKIKMNNFFIALWEILLFFSFLFCMSKTILAANVTSFNLYDKIP